MIEPDSNEVVMPTVLGLSAARIDRTGIYLLDNGLNIILWLGANISPDYYAELFGSAEAQRANTSQVRLSKQKLEYLMIDAFNSCLFDSVTTQTLYQRVCLVL
jgi:protein transport protein SEC24